MVVWFADNTATDAAVTGGKGASLSRMATAGVSVPPGFVVTTGAFAAFLNGRSDADMRTLVLSNPIPEDLERVIRSAYDAMGDNVRVAVRSSAACEDGTAAS